MRSGGRVEFDPNRITDSNNNGSIDGQEGSVERGLTGVESGRSVDNDTTVWFNNNPYRWADLRGAIATSQHQVATSGANLTPDEVSRQVNQSHVNPSQTALLQEMEAQSAAVQSAQRNVQVAEQALTNAGSNQAAHDAAQATLNAAQATLGRLQSSLQNMLAQARNMGIPENRLRPYAQMLGEAARDGGSGGNGSARFMTSSPSFQPLPGPAGGAPAQNGQPARGIGLPGYLPPGGDPLFSGMQPPSSAAYASALY